MGKEQGPYSFGSGFPVKTRRALFGLLFAPLLMGKQAKAYNRNECPKCLSTSYEKRGLITDTTSIGMNRKMSVIANICNVCGTFWRG